jgi:hypothetical protein
VARCSHDDGASGRLLELPIWMFDRSACAPMRVPEPGFHPLIKPVRRVKGDPTGVPEDGPTPNNGELGKPAGSAGSAPSLPDVLGGGLTAEIFWRIHVDLTARCRKHPSP